MDDYRQLLPNFFLLGAACAGTTSLDSYLGQHPQVFMPSVKEAHFFDEPSFYAEGPRRYVEEYYSEAAAYERRGDSTPSYLPLWDIVIPRMVDTYGPLAKELKFIVILRNPVQRAWSQYLKASRTSETESFESALARELQRINEKSISWNDYYRYGLYAEQLEGWFKQFDRSQFHILLTEDLESNPKGAMRAIFRFLDVSTAFEVDTTKRYGQSSRQPRSRWLHRVVTTPPVPIKKLVHRVLPSRKHRRTLKEKLRGILLRSSDSRPVLAPATAAQLSRIYRPEIERLSMMLERDLSHWIESTPAHTNAPRPNATVRDQID